MPQYSVIVGATSGIAKALARQLASSGTPLVLAARDQEELERLAADVRVRYGVECHCCEFDARNSDPASFIARCDELTDNVISEVYLCYGFMAEQDLVESSDDLTRQMFDVNLTSTACLGNRFAERMKSQRHGTIVLLSSVAGDRGRQSNAIYGASKAGLTAYASGLRNRHFKHGVHVLTVKPGFIDTPMTHGKVNPRSPLVASPERVAHDIVRAARRRKNVLYTPWFWRYIMLVIRMLPESLFKRLSL